MNNNEMKTTKKLPENAKLLGWFVWHAPTKTNKRGKFEWCPVSDKGKKKTA